MSFLVILGIVFLLAGGAWVGQLILFLDRKAPFDYGWKGICGALVWLSFIAWAMITVMDKFA